MRKLEEETGSSLFIKEGRNLVLTEAGLSLSSHAKQLVTMHDQALQQLKSNKGKRSLKLGCPEDYNDTILPAFMATIHAIEPRCSVHIYSEPSVTLRQWLDDGKLDAAILTRHPNTEEGYWLTSDQGVWIAAHDYRLNLSMPIPLALFQSDCKYHASAIDGLTKRGINYQLLACCNTASAQRGLVQSGLAIGAMGKLSIGDKVKILPDMPPLPAVDIVLSVSAKGHPTLNSEFLNQLENLYSDSFA